MIKVNLTTLATTREALPKALVGLKQESLNDLSWTDEALGFRGFGYWAESDETPPLADTHKYDGGETFRVDEVSKIVYVTRTSIAKTQAELDAEFKATVPPTITRVQAMKAMKATVSGTGTLWDDFNAVLASNVDAKDEWDLATELTRGHLFVAQLAPALSLTELQIDELFIAGAGL